MRVLVVEDEDRLTGILRTNLERSGFAIDITSGAADAIAAIELITHDAVVLDLGLPDGDGLTVVAAARRLGKALPILILTARDGVEDRVAGLNAGADDYLTKPFAIVELIARIHALLRRPGGVLGITLEAGNLRLDTIGRELEIAGMSVRVARREMAILEQMLRRFGRIVPTAVLEEKLYSTEAELESNPIPVHIHHLRRQLQAAGAALAIHTACVLDEVEVLIGSDLLDADEHGAAPCLRQGHHDLPPPLKINIPFQSQKCGSFSTTMRVVSPQPQHFCDPQRPHHPNRGSWA